MLYNEIILTVMVVLFQKDVLNLLGDIFEEVYGPLTNNETVNGVICSTFAVSELTAVDVTGDSADSCTLVNSSSQLSETAAANSANMSIVMQQPSVEVAISNVQPLNVCDSNVRPAVANSFLPPQPFDLMSDIGSHQSDTARAWSVGTLVTDVSGKSVEVNFHFYIFPFIFALLLLLR